MNREHYLIEKHLEYIESKYTKHRADHANIGWYSEKDAIHSKVYGMFNDGPTEIVTSEYRNRLRKSIRHSVSSYYRSNTKGKENVRV